jgi:hypothetical protein
MHGETSESAEGSPFRVAFGTGLVTVDPAATPHVYDELEELRRHVAVEMASAADDVTGLMTTVGGGVRLRDPFTLFLRDCVAAALKVTERCAVVVARFQFDASGDQAPPSITTQDFTEVLAGQEILCWLNPTEVAVVALGAGPDDGDALSERLRRRLAGRGADAACPLAGFRAGAASYPTDGATIDDLLERLGRALGKSEDSATQAVA